MTAQTKTRIIGIALAVILIGAVAYLLRFGIPGALEKYLTDQCLRYKNEAAVNRAFFITPAEKDTCDALKIDTGARVLEDLK